MTLINEQPFRVVLDNTQAILVDTTVLVVAITHYPQTTTQDMLFHNNDKAPRDPKRCLSAKVVHGT